MQETPPHDQHLLVLRLHGVQRYSSDQLVQCWTLSRHSDLGTQAQYSWNTGLQLHHADPHGGQADTVGTRNQEQKCCCCTHQEPPS